MHRRLAAYFDRKSCDSPDDLAGETLSHVARRLDEESSITGMRPARYCYTVARFVFLEYQCKAKTAQVGAVGDPRSRAGICKFTLGAAECTFASLAP